MKEIKKKNWYVFYTSPRAEKKVNEYLLSLGYESFLPLKSEFKIWRNRQRKLIKSPLFPSYIFVLATRNDIFDINRIYGICYCVTCAGVPAVISGNDIMSLKIMQDIIRKTKCSPLFKRSDISYKTKRPPKNNFPKYSRGSKKSTGKFCFSQCFFL